MVIHFRTSPGANSELFTLTYGAIVTQLLRDYEEVDATNEQLEKMCVGSHEHHPRLPATPCPRMHAHHDRARLAVDIYRGYNIGVRLVDEFLAKAQVGNCKTFAETAEVIAKVLSRPFLRVRSRTF